MRGPFHKPLWVDGRPPIGLLLAAVVLALLAAGMLQLASQPPVGRFLAQVAPKTQQGARAQCVEGVLLSHDVRWAEACARLESSGQTDGHADCELPDAEAERLNRLLQREERDCRPAAPAR
jgi:hypothetical protein